MMEKQEIDEQYTQFQKWQEAQADRERRHDALYEMAAYKALDIKPEARTATVNSFTDNRSTNAKSQGSVNPWLAAVAAAAIAYAIGNTRVQIEEQTQSTKGELEYKISHFDAEGNLIDVQSIDQQNNK